MELLGQGAWCKQCQTFYTDSDPDDPSECEHVRPDRVDADVVLHDPAEEDI